MEMRNESGAPTHKAAMARAKDVPHSPVVGAAAGRGEDGSDEGVDTRVTDPSWWRSREVRIRVQAGGIRAR
jgi:hypothetical protein